MPVAAVVGYPIRHSLSPAIHRAAFRARGLDGWEFLQLACPPDDGARVVRALRLLEVAGASITMPHKRTIIPFLDGLTSEARAVDAVNTIARDGAALIGHNTDGAGFVRFLRGECDCDPRGRIVLMIGAGGAARGAAVSLAQAGAAVRICARRAEQAAEVASLEEGISVVSWEEPGEADILIQATPAREDLPLDRLAFPAAIVAVDMIYAPPATPFMRRARASKIAAYDGLGMLVHQAALAFELWTGVEAPIDAMRAAAVDGLTRAEGG